MLPKAAGISEFPRAFSGSAKPARFPKRPVMSLPVSEKQAAVKREAGLGLETAGAKYGVKQAAHLVCFVEAGSKQGLAVGK